MKNLRAIVAAHCRSEEKEREDFILRFVEDSFRRRARIAIREYRLIRRKIKRLKD